MKVRISDSELSRVIRVGLAVTGKRGQSRDAEPNIMRQFSRYDIFRDATDEEEVSQNVPGFADDYGIARARDEFARETAARRELRRDFDWPLKARAGE